jgi:hypothetical protein
MFVVGIRVSLKLHWVDLSSTAIEMGQVLPSLECLQYLTPLFPIEGSSVRRNLLGTGCVGWL